MIHAERPNIRRLRGLPNIAWLTTRQLGKLADELTVTTFDKHVTIFDDKLPTLLSFILISGIARITCTNRKGTRSVVIILGPGIVPGFPPPTAGIRYNFRCEAVTECEVGTLKLESLIAISLGVKSADFQRMALGYFGRWDLVRLRCANFMGCALDERLALTLLELAEHFGTRDGLGTRLNLVTRHKDLADLVGGSRPRITEQLLDFRRKHFVTLRNRRLVIREDRLGTFLNGARNGKLSNGKPARKATSE